MFKIRFACVILAVTVLCGCDPYKPGKEMMARGEYEQAARFFMDLVKKRPKDPLAHHELAFAYSRLRMYEQAEAEYEEALELDPDAFQTNLNLGTILIKMDRHEDAVPYLEKAVKLKPDDEIAHANLAAALTRLHRYDEAVAELKKAGEVSTAHNNYDGEIKKLLQYKEDWQKSDEFIKEKNAAIDAAKKKGQ